MNILIITSSYPTVTNPSLGSFVESQVNLLKTKGNFVDVIICNFRNTSKRNPYKLSLCLFSKLKLFLDNITYLDVSYIKIGDKLFSQRFDFINPQKIYSYDVIHAHDCIWAGYLSYLFHKKYKLNYVVTSHVPYVINDNWLNFKLTYKVLNNAKLIFTVGQQDKNMLSCVFSSEKMQVIGNFIDEDVYSPAVNMANEKFTISMISSTSVRKNIPLFLRLIEIIVNSNDVVRAFEVILVLAEVSDGITVDEVRFLIKKMGLGDVIQLKLNLTQTEILDVYRKTNLYVSTSGLETFGMTIAEALSMDIPTVAIKNGASEDFISTDYGSVFLETDNQEIVNRIIEHINGLVFCKKSHDYIKSNFGSDAFYKKLMAGYKSLMS